MTKTQLRVYRYVTRRGEVGREDIRKLLGCASRTAGLHLWNLHKAGLVRPDGVGRFTRWRPAEAETPRDVIGVACRWVFEWRP